MVSSTTAVAVAEPSTTSSVEIDTLPSNDDLDSRTFVYGNPFVEKKIGGILHFYKRVSVEENTVPSDCSMICMMGVPAFFTCRELIKFVMPMADAIFKMRIIRDDTPNQYMVLLNFKSQDLAVSFYEQYNNMEFNSIEAEQCTLFFVERLEMTSDDDDVEAVVYDSLAEPAPTCSVCLERMDDGLLTILCNHTFHAECLRKWSDTTEKIEEVFNVAIHDDGDFNVAILNVLRCPVCRNSQTPELVPDQTCKECNKTSDLWMCLICGNIGCGRYSMAHAYQHYEATSHIFTLQVGSKLVWDYASDAYVHRLIKDSTDGKVIEYQGDESSAAERKDNEKLDAIQMEYSFILTSQLECQRLYFEEKLREAEERRVEVEKASAAKISALQVKLDAKTAECSRAFDEASKQTAAKLLMEKKHAQLVSKVNKLQSELGEERQLNGLLIKDKELLSRQRDELEKLRMREISGLEEQLHDFMMHFDAQTKIQGALRSENITNQELEESQVEVKMNESSSSTSTSKRTSGGGGRRGGKRSTGG